MRSVLQGTIVGNARFGTARLKYTIVVDLPFLCEDKFKPKYREYTHDREVITNAGTFMTLFKFDLKAIEEPVVVLTKKIGAQRVTGGLDSNEEGVELDDEDGVNPDPVFSIPL